MTKHFWRLRPLIALFAAITVYGQSIDAAAAKVREAEAALHEAQESYKKALLEQAAALRAQADAIEAKARGAVVPVAGNVRVGAPSVRILPVAAVAADPAPVVAAAPPPPPAAAATPPPPPPPQEGGTAGTTSANQKLTAKPSSVSLVKGDKINVAFKLGETDLTQDGVTVGALASGNCTTTVTNAWTDDKKFLVIGANALPSGTKRLDCKQAITAKSDTTKTFDLAISVVEGKLSVTPPSLTLDNNEQRKLTFKVGNDALTKDSVTVGTLDPEICADKVKIGWSADNAAMTVTAGKLPNGVRRLDCKLAVNETADATKKVTIPISVVDEKAGEWEARAVFGFHQAGASSTESKQNYFFDFFIMRGLGNHEHVYNSRVNVWGNVRIASAPQQVDTGVANFITNFAGTASQVKVNQLAQSGEFLTGLGLRMKKWDQGARLRMLEFVTFWGANGSFSDPITADTKIFKTPKAPSTHLAPFQSQFSKVTSTYVAFTPPDRERFYRQYGGGIRLTGWELQRPYAPPSTYMVTLGQDQLVTGGYYRGVVARADVFYPLPIGKEDGKWQFLYLFGTANLRLSKPSNGPVFALEPAGTRSAAGVSPVVNVNVYDSDVTVVSRPSSRDTYRIGVGIDFVNLFNSWRATRTVTGAGR